MSGICSIHQHYDAECRRCNAIKPVPKVLLQINDEPETFISVEVDSDGCFFYVPGGMACISKEEARTLLAGLIHFAFCEEDEHGNYVI